MNASKFMDKQIMELSGSGAQSGGGGGDLLELLGEDHRNSGAGGKKDEILPSYDFQPIRTVGSSSAAAGGADGGRTWGSADSSMAGGSNSRTWNYGSLEAHDSSKVIHDKHKEANDASMLVEFDRTVKKYADKLMHALEDVSSRLSQLEDRTHNLESAVDDLKLSVANNSGSTDGKLRQLDNILREVQTGVQVLRDKQEITETQMQLAKLRTTKGDHQRADNPTVAPSETRQPQVPPTQQPLQQPARSLVAAAPPPPAPIPTTQRPALPMPPAPNAPPPPPQNPPPGQFSSHVSQTQLPSIPSMPPREPYFAPPGLPLSEIPQLPYQPPQQRQLPPPQQYQPAPQLQQYSQPPPHPQASVPHHHEEPSPYMPPHQSYPPSIHQSPQLPPGPVPQQFHGSDTTVYEPPKLGPSSGQQPFSAGYGPPSVPGFSDSYPYSGSPSQYSSGLKPSPFSSSTPRLPTAQLLPQAPPTASSSGSSSGDRVPIDDVVDKVATMGFPRDVVRATVRRLTENGQNVDLNVVLDKLMNDSENQPQKAWFGR